MSVTMGRRRSIAILSTVMLAVCAVVPGAAVGSPVSPAPPVMAAAQARSTIFGGGPLYQGGQQVMDTLRSSGFTTVVLWTIHVRSGSADLWFNDDLVISNGRYVGDPEWPARLRSLRQAPTSVNRIEVGVGSAGPDDWGVIADLVRSQGTGPGSILFRNFQVLKQITGAEAINNDDEQHFDLDTTTRFARMAVSLGYKFTIVPFHNTGYWQALRSNLGAAMDRVYVQAYAGGDGNDPTDWGRDMGMPVDPGLWSRHGDGCGAGDSPSQIGNRMRGWRQSAGIQGGFIWLFDDIQRCSGQGSVADYARAVNDAVGVGSPPPPPPPPPTPDGNLALNRPATGSAPCAAAQGPAKAVNGSVSGGNVDRWCSTATGTRFLRVDLGSTRSLTSFVVRHAQAGGERASFNTRDFDLQVSADGSRFTTVARVRGNTAAVSTHAVNSNGRFIRLNVIAGGQTGNAAAHIYEFEAYGTDGR